MVPCIFWAGAVGRPFGLSAALEDESRPPLLSSTQALLLPYPTTHAALFRLSSWSARPQRQRPPGGDHRPGKPVLSPPVVSSRTIVPGDTTILE